MWFLSTNHTDEYSLNKWRIWWQWPVPLWLDRAPTKGLTLRAAGPASDGQVHKSVQYMDLKTIQQNFTFLSGDLSQCQIER